MFELNQSCTLEQCLGGRGNHEDSKPWCNLTFSFDDLDCKAVAAVLNVKGGAKAIRESFFTDDGKNKFPGMDMIQIGRKFEGTHAIRISGGAKMACDRLMKVRLTPYGKNTFSGQFQVTIGEVPPGFYDTMYSKLHETMKIALTQEKRDLFEESNDEDGGEQGDAFAEQAE